MVKSIAIASDHAGYDLKEALKGHLQNWRDIAVTDFGTSNGTDSVDYPDFAAAVARGVADGTYEAGLLVCGTGIGMAIMANRFPGVRAANCNDIFSAVLSRQHNDANVLTVGSRVVAAENAKAILDAFLATEFDGGSRHCRRIEKLDAPAPASGK
jgi:ribose 5-phosphate isomerase B